MNIVITGGAGFLGARLARELLKRGQLALAGAAPQTIQTITLVDRAAPPADLAADRRIRSVVGPNGAPAPPSTCRRSRQRPAKWPRRWNAWQASRLRH